MRLQVGDGLLHPSQIGLPTESRKLFRPPQLPLICRLLKMTPTAMPIKAMAKTPIVISKIFNKTRYLRSWLGVLPGLRLGLIRFPGGRRPARNRPLVGTLLKIGSDAVLDC